MPRRARLDTIGPWSEVKLDIIREYAQAYSSILSAQQSPAIHHAYIDAFAGPGTHLSKRSREYVPGSPLNALIVSPPFKQYFFIDLDGRKVKSLEAVSAKRTNVSVYHGDCNHVLLNDVFPQVRYEQFRRALLILDPYGLHLDWTVIAKAGSMRTIEIFLNFPIMDINRNVLSRTPDKAARSQLERLNAYWGDDSWRRIAYEATPTLFGTEDFKVSNARIAEAFRRRLIDCAGFKFVPEPLPMKNSKNAILYYLYFASQKPVAEQIMRSIFTKHSKRTNP